MRRYNLLIAICLILVFPVAFFTVPGVDLDSSYNIALHLAHQYGLVFGKDIVFTFGPLGILNTRLPIAVHPLVYICFDIYFFCTLFFVLRALFRKRPSYPIVAYILLGVALAAYEPSFEWYFLFFLFYLFAFIRDPAQVGSLVQAVVLSVILFYYKVNMGVMAVFLFLFGMVFVVVVKKIRWPVFAGVVGGYFLLIWVLSLMLDVALPGYIRGSLQLIDGYNDAMYFPPTPLYNVFIGLAIVVILVVLGWAGYVVVVAKDAMTRCIHLILMLAAFTLFKSGIVRADGAHLSHIYFSVALAAGFLYLYTPPGKRVAAGVCCWAVLTIVGVGSNWLPGSEPPYQRYAPIRLVRMSVSKFVNYYEGIRHYPGLLVGKGPLKERIGDHTTDVFPRDVSTIYYNGLHYDPRPVLQSYSAYTTYLDSLDAEKYLSPGAPDNILLSLSTIDGRYAFSDEPRTMMAMMGRYEIMDSLWGQLILRKRKTALDGGSMGGGSMDAHIGEDITIPGGDSVQYTKVFVHYSLWGKIRRWLFQPPPLKITLTLDHGETVTYRAIPPLLADGMIINRYAHNLGDLRLFMLSHGRMGAPVKKFRIEGGSGFEEQFRVENTFYRFPPVTGDDSIGVAGQLAEYDRHRPLPADSSHYVTAPFDCWIERVEDYSPLINIEGWARTSDSVKLLLRSNDHLFELPVMTAPRPDVVSYYHWTDHVKGFAATVSVSQLPPGKYQIGVLINDKQVRYTDQTTTIYGLAAATAP